MRIDKINDKLSNCRHWQRLKSRESGKENPDERNGGSLVLGTQFGCFKSQSVVGETSQRME